MYIAFVILLCIDYFRAAIMYVVIEVERNIYDHRWLEYHIHDKLPNVRVIRRTMKQLRTAMKVTDDHRLIVYVRSNVLLE